MPIELSVEQIARQRGIAGTFDFIERFICFRDRRIYEIGSDRFFVSAIEMMRMGARSVTCTNIAEARVESVANVPGISFHKVDSARSGFESGSFDVVYGRAVLEHIHDFGALVAEIKRLLKPGGTFYLDGGPMWTCQHGHHVWVDPAPSGAKYIFPTHSTFRPWEHLMYSRQDIVGRLEGRGIPSVDVTAIVDHVYASSDQNRIAPSAIVEAFESDPNLDLKSVRVAVGAEPPTIAPFSTLDLQTGSLHLIGRKLAPGDRPGDFRDFVSAGMKLLRGRFLS